MDPGLPSGTSMQNGGQYPESVPLETLDHRNERLLRFGVGILMVGSWAIGVPISRAEASPPTSLHQANPTGRSASLPLQTDSSWKRHVSAEGRYSVFLPGNPEETSEETTLGEFGKSRKYTVTAFDADGLYTVEHIPMPASLPKSRETAFAVVEGVAAGIREAVIKEGLSIRRSSNTLMGTAPGKEMEIGGPFGEMAVRVYLKNNILFVLTCLTRKDSDPAASCKKFLDSFRVSDS
jgi:hypothetical protein